MKKPIWLSLQIGVSTLFVWLAFREISWEELSNSFVGVSAGLVLVSMVLNLFSCWLRAVRWQFLMKPIQGISQHRVFSALMIGFMVNNILPFRLGEIARAYALKNSDGISFSAVMGTVVIERILDVFFLLIIFASLLFWFPFPDWVRAGSLLIGLVIAGATLFLWVLARRSEIAFSWVRRVSSVFGQSTADRAESVMRSFVNGVRFSHSIRDYAMISVLSVFIWLSYIYVIHTMMLACHFDAAGLGLGDATVVMVFTSFAIMIPAAPGYVGTFHEIAKQSLMALHIGRGAALAWAILFHAAHYVLITGAGFVYFLTNRFRLGDAFESVSPSAT